MSSIVRIEGRVFTATLPGDYYIRFKLYDSQGQLLTGTFMDFLVPTAMEVPDVAVGHIETPSPLNPLGVKGVGEAGAIPGPAVIAEAIDDALAPWSVRVREMPLSPEAILTLLDRADGELRAGDR